MKEISQSIMIIGFYGVAGICGKFEENENIKFCYNSGDIRDKGNTDIQLGVSGICWGWGNVECCYNSGDLKIENSKASCVNIGGIMFSLKENQIVTNCFNFGNLSADGCNAKVRIGGIFAWCRGGFVDDCWFMKDSDDRMGCYDDITGICNTIQEGSKENMIKKIINLDFFIAADDNVNEGFPILSF